MGWNAEDFDSDWPFDEQGTKFELRNNKTALLVIDIQKGDLVKDKIIVLIFFKSQNRLK